MRCMMPFLPSTRSFWEGCAPAARRAPAAMWPGDVWHLWPGTYRHLWLALVIVVGLYAWDAKRSLPAPTDLNLALEVAALDAARRGSWRPVPAWVTRAIALARAAHVACFGAIQRPVADFRETWGRKPMGNRHRHAW